MFNALLGCYAAALAESAHRKGELLTSETKIWTDDCALNQDAVTAAAMGTVCSEIYTKDPKLEQSDDMLRQTIISRFRKICNQILDVRYTRNFFAWLQSDAPQPFGSLGAGAALRAIGPAMLFEDMTLSLRMTRLCTEITHNHPEGINGALAMNIALKALQFRLDYDNVKEELSKHFSYDMTKDYDDWKAEPPEKATCEECICAALASVEASDTFDDAVRKALSMKGPRIVASLAGAMAMAHYGKKDSGLNWLLAVLKSVNSPETKELTMGMMNISTIKNEEYSKSEDDNTIQLLLTALDFKKCLLEDKIPFMAE